MINIHSVSKWFSLSHEEQLTLNEALKPLDRNHLSPRLDGIKMLAGKIQGRRSRDVANLLIKRCILERAYQKRLSGKSSITADFEDYPQIRDRSINLELASHECSFFKEKDAWVAVVESEEDLKVHRATKHLFLH